MTTSPATDAPARIDLRPLVVLGAAQFLMVLDQAVMNVSISQLVADFDTDVTTIQAVITFYSLVMAALMITGGKLGDLLGRRRAFTIGIAIYGLGSGLTAVSWSVASLTLGWSVLEGIGAALVLPALAALVAGNYHGAGRTFAYGVIGGVAGAGIAVGPILGGWATTVLSWRVVFAGEVAIVVTILLLRRWLTDAPAEGEAPRFDIVGAVLSAVGLALTVYAVLQSSTWGWVAPKDSPVTPFGFALTPFVLMAGLALIYGFRRWIERRQATGHDPLVDPALLRVPPVRAGLLTFTSQNLILMGVFFAMPLYLQVMQGLDALQTGLRLLPVSVTMLIAASAGPRLSSVLPVRTIVRIGIGLLMVASLLLLSTIEPTLEGPMFAVAMAVLGTGLGLIASQLGNVIQSSVSAAARSEAGGLQYTAQQFGSALGVALIGAVVLSGLASGFLRGVAANPKVSAEIYQAIETRIGGGVDFAASSVVAEEGRKAGLDAATTAAVVADYEQAQINALKAGLLLVAVIAFASFAVTGDLPERVPGGDDDEEDREADPLSDP
jgi:MFS family permease